MTRGAAHPIGLSSSASWLSVISPTNIVTDIRELVSSPQFRDGIKFFAIGAALSSTQTIARHCWSALCRLVVSRALVRSTDPAFDAALSYIVKTAHRSRASRDVEVSSTAFLSGIVRPSDGDAEGYQGLDDPEETSSASEYGEAWKKKRAKVYLFPIEAQTFRFWFQGTPVWATRRRERIGDCSFEEMLELSFLTFSTGPAHRFFVEARQVYDGPNSGKVKVHSVDKYQRWQMSAARAKRSMESIHLPGDTKEKLLSDASAFLLPSNHKWYAERGIPYRRGYLLYGTPGSGKTSTVHALASVLDLDIYTVTLTSKTMTNAVFQELIADVPSKSIVLIEDIDAVFQTRVARDFAESESEQDESGGGNKKLDAKMQAVRAAAGRVSDVNRTDVTFSTLLNTIDGVGAPEGRILIMTTNHRELLDDALIRPGRIDLQLAYTTATKKQLGQLFARWYEQLMPKSTDGGAHPVPDPVSEKAHLDHEALRHLMADFVGRIPEGRFSVAAVQGYLLLHKEDPYAAVEGVERWIQEQAA